MSKKTYAGIPAEFAREETSKVVLLPVPYDGTSTWVKGSDKGPEAFLDASENMELYDIETNSEPYKNGVFLSDPITENQSPEKMVQAVYQATKNFLSRGKFVTIFGGEHSVSIGSIRAFNESFDNLTVLQIDAHADLRREYEGSTCNHACAMYEANQNCNLVQVGIRSMDISETRVMNKEQVFFAHEMAEDDYWIDQVIDCLTDNVYITIDLDGFDPSILPSTGTPEPGGLQWYETLELLRRVNEEKNVVGFDIVELCPNPSEKSSDFVAAKLYYKLLAYKFNEEDESSDDFETEDASTGKKGQFDEDDY